MSSSFPVEFSGKVKNNDFSNVEINPYLEVNNDHHYGVESKSFKYEKRRHSIIRTLQKIRYRITDLFIKDDDSLF